MPGASNIGGHVAEVDESGVAQLGAAIAEQVGRVIVGKADQTRLITAALLAGGHVLLDDVPGVAKTLLVRAFAASLGLSFSRIQCTADLLPSDVTGSTVFNQQTGAFEFRPGPVFANIVLADEINRATPRTQSAFLEAMQEGGVTVDGTTHVLPQPFMVLATQNPIELKGTFPLPEAQLDRFLLRVRMGYPSEAEEVEMLMRFRAADPMTEVRAVAVADALPRLKQSVRDVHVSEDMALYIAALARATREAPMLRLGASPRSSLALLHASQACAALAGRGFVTPDDVQGLVAPVLAHRLLLSRDASLAQRDPEAVLREIVTDVPVPAESPGTTTAG
jgi:MoxR-like ATPase